MALDPAFLQSLLQGLGQGLTAYGSGNPNWGAAGAQGIADARQQQRIDATGRLQMQIQQEQLQRQRQQDEDERRKAAAARSWLLGQQMPATDSASARSVNPASGAISSLPAAHQSFYQGYADIDPIAAAQMAGQEMLKAPDTSAPTTRDFNEGGNVVTKQWDPGSKSWVALSTAPRWQPIQPPQMPGDYRIWLEDKKAHPEIAAFQTYRGWATYDPNKKEKSPLVDLTPDQVKAHGLPAGTVAQVDPNDNSIHVVSRGNEGGGPFPGASVDSAALNIIIAGQNDPALREKPEYRTAWHQMYETPRYQQVPDPRDPTGSTLVLMAVTPQPPDGLLGPGGGAAPVAAPAPASPSPAPAALPKGGAPMSPPLQGSANKPGNSQVSFISGTETTKARPTPPAGYEYTQAGNLQPIPGGPADPNTPTPEQRNLINQKLAGLDRLQKALDNYKNLVAPPKGTTGPDGKPLKPVKPGIAGSVLGLPTEDASQLGTAYTALAIEAKNLFELGALSGPDYGLIQQTLKDPNTTGGYLQSDDGRLNQIEEVQKILNNSRSSWEKNYGPALRQSGSGGKSIDALKDKYGITPVKP
jgi:hypothetical protein